MALDTYAALQTSVAGWLNRADLATTAPDFISLAEAEFNRKIRVRDNTVRATLSASAEYTDLPADFREAKFIKFTASGVDTPLGFLDQRSMVEKREQFNGVPGRPQYYSLLGSRLELCPDPDTTYSLILGYYGSIPALSGSNTTNWLLTKHPDLYLYGSLLQSAPYLKDDERIPVWRDAYSQILESIRLEDLGAMYSGGTLRVNARSIG